MQRIYLDNSATTAMDPKVIETMNEAYLSFGNPSSLHSFGQEARRLIDESRDIVSGFLNCKPTEVIFTSGGSESDNLAIRGIIEASQQVSKSASQPHVVTSAIEHHAVLHTIQDLEKEGKIEATYIKPGNNGVVDVKDIEEAMRPNTILVSVMYVNNETGCVQPIREIGKMIEKINLRSSKGNVASSKDNNEINSVANSHATSYMLRAPERKSKIFFHTDAVQAAEFLNMDTKYLHVDLLTLTGHKIHGPKGIGVLFVKKGTPIQPMITGGDHEFRLRAGTENVAAISGLGTAIAEITKSKLQISNKNPNSKNQNSTDCHSERSEESSSNATLDPSAVPQDDKHSRIKRLRDKLENFILKNIPDTYLNGDKEKRAPHIANISFKNAEGEAIILNLDFLGIAVSSGSACTARSLESSHVLSAMNLPHELAHGAIRFSLSKYTTEEEIDKVCEVLPGIIAKLRQMSPFS